MLEQQKERLFLKLAFLLTAQVFLSSLGSAAPPAELYDREAKFGSWLDLDFDGQDTRAEIIHEQSINKQDMFWVCPYTGKVFVSSKTMDVDHIVPLNAAWDCGADKWPQERREQFANDPENLLLVSASANRSKGAQRADQWLPTNLSFIDDYIDKTLHIYNKYDLMCPDPDPLDLAITVKNLKGVKPWQLNLK